MQRFLDAAMELYASGPNRDFTVQEVVERSGQSLRSFYQYFSGKHELLLALFEESVSTTAERLAAEIADEEDPLERLHRFVVRYYQVCRPSDPNPHPSARATPVMAEFAQQLLTAHPKEAARAFQPIASLFDQLLGDAAAAGALRPELQRSRIVGVVLEAIMFNAFSATIGGAGPGADGQEPGEDLWDLVMHGIGRAPAT